MGSRIHRDSRYRTIQIESGKVFVIWFGASFKRHEGSAFKVGAEVELLAGSSLQAALMRVKDMETTKPEVWHFRGFLGGEKNRQSITEEWAKIQADLGNPHPVLPESTQVKAAKNIQEDRDSAPIVTPYVPSEEDTVDWLMKLAVQYDCVTVKQTMAASFAHPDDASTFKLTAKRHGFDVETDVINTPEGRYTVEVQLKHSRRSK